MEATPTDTTTATLTSPLSSGIGTQLDTPMSLLGDPPPSWNQAPRAAEWNSPWAGARAARAAAAEVAQEQDNKYVSEQMKKKGLSDQSDYPYALISKKYEEYKAMLETEDPSGAITTFTRLFPNAGQLEGKRINGFVTTQYIGPREYRSDTIESMAERDRETNGIFNGPAAAAMKKNMRAFMTTCSNAGEGEAIHYLTNAGGNLQQAVDRYYQEQEAGGKRMDISKQTFQTLGDPHGSVDSLDETDVRSMEHDPEVQPPEPEPQQLHSFDELIQLLESLGEPEVNLSIKDKISIISIVLSHFMGIDILEWQFIIGLLRARSKDLTPEDIDALYDKIHRKFPL